MNTMLEQFNLPRYIDGLSFADASKKIQSKFKERTDPESISTEKEMLDRLKQMQEHVKAQKEAQEQPERSRGDLVAGSEGMPLDEEEITQEYNQEQGAEEDLMSQIQSAYGGNQYAYGGPGEETPQWKSYMQGQSKMALGGDEEDLHSMPKTAPQRFAPTIRAQNDSIFSSLASIGKSAVSSLAPVPEVPGGQMAWGGPVPDGGSEYYANNNPLFMQDQPSFNGQVVPPEATAPVTPKDTPGVGISGKIAGGAEALTAAASLGKDAFGPSNVDTSGRVHVEKQKIGNAMVSGAAKGAKVGSEIGKYIPIPGAGVIATAASSVIGAGLGYLGANKQRKAADIANRNATYADAAVNDNQFADGGDVDPINGKNKDVRRTSESLLIKPISELGHTLNRVIPTNTGKLQYSKSSDPEYNSARKEFVDWYADPATKTKFAKNTGYDPERLYDMTSKATSTPSYKGDAYKQPPVGTKAIFNTPDVGGKKEEIIYHKGIGSGPIQHELTHAGAMANLIGPALLRTLGSPKSQRLPSDINDPNFKSASNASKEYLSIPEEAYGNFHEFRVNLGLKPGEKINKEILRKRVKEKNLQNENFYSTFEDDKIVDAINKIAYTGRKKDINQNQAAMGGHENKINQNIFDEGGDTNLARGYSYDPKTKKYTKIKGNIESINSLNPKEMVDKKTIYTGKKDGDRDLISNYTKENKLGLIKLPNLGKKQADKMTAMQKLKLAGINAAEFAGNNKDALRYAPAIGNIMQLAKLKKPEQETTPELSTRYKKNVVDEQGLVNLVREETAGNREAILSSSEGSGNAARANLLGTQLNATKALSDAFMKSQEANARENTQEQSFNLGVDTTNLQQQTLAQDIRARNKGAYDTEKSRLKTAVAADLGSIGQEELYKKFPELMGSDYDWKGKYKKLLADQKLKDAATA